MIKLVILDIDGVMTDGKKYYNENGMPFLKTFCDKDFTAIKRMRAGGTEVCFLSGDRFVNEAMAKNRNIDFFYARGKDKVEFLEMLCQKYSTTPEHIAYVGDDLFDKNIMKAIKYPFCPSDSVMDIKAICGFNNILSKNGGENVVMELVDLLLKKKLINDATLEQIEALDKNEKF